MIKLDDFDEDQVEKQLKESPNSVAILIEKEIIHYDGSKLVKTKVEKIQFKHDKFSESCNNVLRGIHGDSKSWKLVTAVYGEIFQVVVDLRKDSNSFKQYESFTLNSHSPKSVLIPPGMGNAYYVLSKKAVYHYKLAYDGEYIDADEQFSFAWNDKSINIEWPSNKPILSERDK